MAESIHRWNVIHGITLATLSICVILFHTAVPVIIFATGSFGYYVIYHQSKWDNGQLIGGWANGVTLLRLSIVLTLPLVYQGLHNLALLAVFITFLFLDGLDGYLARKLKSATEFGAQLDMETDALFMAILSAMLYFKGLVPAWVILPGFLRYFHVTIQCLIGRNFESPAFPFARATAVTVFIIFLSPLVLPSEISLYLLAAGGGLLAISFLYPYAIKMGYIRRQTQSLPIEFCGGRKQWLAR